MLGHRSRKPLGTSVARILCNPRSLHGESPLWLAASGRLLALDCGAALLLVIDPTDGATHRLPLPEPCFWIVACQEPSRFIAGFRHRIVEIDCDLARGITELSELFCLPPQAQGVRFNDAKVGTHGRIITGTMDEGGVRPAGALYSIAHDRTVTMIDDGYTIPNGPAYCPEGRLVYLADSAARRIYAYTLDAGGALSDRRIHIRFGEDDGQPDGMACDAQGGLWVAHWGAGCVTRFLPDGTPDRIVPIPAKAATSVAFFGPDLRRLAVTSAVHGRLWRKTGGAVYQVDAGVAGVPIPPFGSHPAE